MKNYTITKEQILSLYDNAIKDNSDIIEIDLKEYFPDAFKKELEVGRWYKSTADIEFLICYQGNNMENYGFWEYQGFRNNLYFSSCWSDQCIEATPQQVATALRNEAKKIGFIDGAKFKSFEHGNPIRTVRESGIFNFNMISNHLLISTPESEWDNYQSNPAIFEKGKWATILPEETKVITMEKAVKILSKKYGQKVEIK